MDIIEAVYGRRAVREFTSEPIEQQTLQKLIGAAVQAPSAVNEQPWSFFVVRDRSLLARISREAKAHMLRTTPAGLVSHHFLHTRGVTGSIPVAPTIRFDPSTAVAHPAAGDRLDGAPLAADPGHSGTRRSARHPRATKPATGHII